MFQAYSASTHVWQILPGNAGLWNPFVIAHFVLWLLFLLVHAARYMVKMGIQSSPKVSERSWFGNTLDTWTDSLLFYNRPSLCPVRLKSCNFLNLNGKVNLWVLLKKAIWILICISVSAFSNQNWYFFLYYVHTKSALNYLVKNSLFSTNNFRQIRHSWGYEGQFFLRLAVRSRGQ